MFKYLLSSFIIVTLMSGCSRNSIFPADTKVYDSPVNYAHSYEEFYFESSQGAMLRSWLFRSKGPSQGIVVVANGMIFNMSERFKEWTWLLERGYDLFIFDYRGYGESSGEVDMFGFVDDVASAIEYAHALNEELPMAVVGQSMGGSFVIDAAARKPYPYVRLLVIDSTMRGFASAGRELMQKHILLWPWSWAPEVFTPKGVDSIDFVDQTATPMLFLVGLNDEVIQPNNSADLYVKANEPKALWIVEGAEHVQCINHPQVKEDLSEVIDTVVSEKGLLSAEVRFYEQNLSDRHEAEEEVRR